MANKIYLSSISGENKLPEVYMEIIVFILRTLHKRIILLFVPYFAHLINNFFYNQLLRTNISL